ncbi:MAG: hypothetical protein LQ344_007726 [Seirophora lacunosa]|nr:MAG: hypothetical protein LQ344_007726 [Seirophora lacunosa]
MTPLFYARYIPTAKVPTATDDFEHHEAAQRAKKRRKHRHDSIEDISGPKKAVSKIALNPDTGHLVANRVPSSSQNEEEASQTSKGNIRTVQDPPSEKTETTSLPHSENRSRNRIRNSPEPPAAGMKKKRKKSYVEDSQSQHEAHELEEPQHIKVLSKYQKSVRAATESTKIPESPQGTQDSSAAPLQTQGLTPIPQPPQTPDAPRPSDFGALPAWLTEPLVASGAEVVRFDTLPLDSDILTSLQARGYTEAFAIQAAGLPLLLPGERQHLGDLCISAATGSGKTLAYVLPMVEALCNKPVTRLRGLIVVPTRELVNQARDTLELCGSRSGLKIGTAYGSKTLQEEQKSLVTQLHRYDPNSHQKEQNRAVDDDEELLNWDPTAFDERGQAEDSLVGYVVDHSSKIDILICTPGRLIEHLQHTRGFTLDHVQWLVIDEADRLLEESFQQWVEIVVPALEHQSPADPVDTLMMRQYHLSRKRDLRKIILSATMTRDISKLKELKLRRPKLVVLKSELEPTQTNVDTLDQHPEVESGEQVELPPTLEEAAIQIKDEENKPLYLMELLKQLSSNQVSLLPGQDPEKKTQAERDNSSNDSSDSESTSSNSTSPASSHSPSTSSESSSESDPPQKRISTVRGSLIFTHSTASAHRLSRLLAILSPSQASMTATMTKSSVKSSKKILSQMRSGSVTTIISTDRASRGLDIPDLAHVINYDMPPSVNSYVHRVGRTARAGKAGTATTLVGWKEGRWFWNEIGRGKRIQRGARKIARRSLKDGEWGAKELGGYADALTQLGQETRGEPVR